MLSSCLRADLAGLLAGHTKLPFTLSMLQSAIGAVCLRRSRACGTPLPENLVYLDGWAAAARPFFVSGPQAELTQAQQRLEASLEQLIDPICRAHGVELVDVRYVREPKGAVIRVIIDRDVPGLEVGSGVSLEDCTGVSRDLSTALDVHEDILPAAGYRLEVSSPGLERPVRWPEHWRRFRGRAVRVKASGIPGRPTARIVDVPDDAHVTLGLPDGRELTVPLDEIREATLVVDWDSISKR